MIKFIQEYKLLIFLISVSLLARIVFITFLMENDKYYWEDTIHYYTAAESVLEGNGFGNNPEFTDKEVPYDAGPVYPLFLAPFVLLSKGNFLIIRLVQQLIYVLSAFLIYKMLLMHVSKTYALIGSFLFLFYPFYIYFGGLILTEGIYTPLLIAYIYYTLVYYKRGEIKKFYISIVLLALLGHIKVQTWSLCLVSMIVFFYNQRFLNWTLLKRGFITLVIFIAICTPYGIRNYQNRGTIALPRNSGFDTEESELKHRFKTRDNLLVNTANFFSPSLTGVDSTNKFTGNLYSLISIVSVIPLILGMLILPLFRRNKSIGFLYLILASYALPYIILFARTRFRVPIDFIMIMFLTLLIAEIWKRFIPDSSTN